MSQVTALLERCQALGAVLTPIEDRIRVEAVRPLPAGLLNELRQSKAEVLWELRYRLRQEGDCWLLNEWRRISLPEWRRILQESIKANDKKRADYARWMLKEILEDPECKPGDPS